MHETADLSPTIVETLYYEALMLADEAREAFELSGRLTLTSANEDLTRVALSCEALRTTTRMMHGIAWLLNHRAYFAGELSEYQLRRHGRLPPAPAEADTQPLAVLPAELLDLVERTRQFYARVERLDHAWHGFAMPTAALHRLHDRLGKAVASL